MSEFHPSETPVTGKSAIVQTVANALAVCVAAQGLGPILRGESDNREIAMLGGEQPVQMQGVVVTGKGVSDSVASPKFTQPVVDTPQTIEVIPTEVYTAQGATTLSEVLRNTPGITFYAGEGGSANRTGGDSFYLRGFDTSNSIFIDGVRDEGAVVHDTFNIGQVEVFKGPSPDNGRGGTAGYINLETKLPEAHAFQDLETAYGFAAAGSQANERATLDLNQPLADSPVKGTAVRLNLMDQEGGVPGRQYAENNRWGVAPSLALGLGTPTRVFVAYEHQYEHNLPDYGLPSTAVPGYAPPASPTAPSFYSPGVNPSTYYGFVDFNYEHVTTDVVTERIEHDFANVKLSNQTRYDATSRLIEASSPSGSVTAAPAGEVAVAQAIYQTENQILSNLTSLQALFTTGAWDHALTAGLELSRETADNPTWVTVPLGVANPNFLLNIYQPADFPSSLLNYAPHQPGSGVDTRINTEAAYAFDTIKIGKKWELSGGVRLEHYNIDQVTVATAAPAIAALPATATTAATTAVAAVPASVVALGAGKTTASWKGGLVYKPAPDGSLYISYATSTRPPGTSSSTNALSTTISTTSYLNTGADDPLLQPEKTINYEAGAKWNFLHEHLLAELAFFRSVNTNVPAADPVTGIIDQSSDQTVSGVELGLSGKITEAWLVYGGFSQMDVNVSNELSTNTGGLTLPLLPKESGNLWTTYAVTKGLTVGAGVQYMGETERLQATNAPVSTTPANQVPAFWLCSAMASYSFNKHFSLRLNVNNLANREYVTSLNNNGYRLNLGTPRSFLLTAELKF